MGSPPTRSDCPAAPGRVVSCRPAPPRESPPRHQRPAHLRTASVSPDPADPAESLGRRGAAAKRQRETAIDLGSALRRVSQLPGARPAGATRDQHALPEVQRPLRHRLGRLLVFSRLLYCARAHPVSLSRSRDGPSAIRPPPGGCRYESSPWCVVPRGRARRSPSGPRRQPPAYQRVAGLARDSAAAAEALERGLAPASRTAPHLATKYGVCPSCRGRSPLPKRAATLECRRCQQEFEVNWEEGYLAAT